MTTTTTIWVLHFQLWRLGGLWSKNHFGRSPCIRDKDETCRRRRNFSVTLKGPRYSHFKFWGTVYFYCGPEFQIAISRLLINIFDSEKSVLQLLWRSIKMVFWPKLPPVALTFKWRLFSNANLLHLHRKWSKSLLAVKTVQGESNKIWKRYYIFRRSVFDFSGQIRYTICPEVIYFQLWKRY